MRCKASFATTACEQKYGVVVDKLKELSALNGISGLLGWDEVRRVMWGAA
jgi:hypothetical protein